MTSNHSHSSLCRFEGCTLTGALSVTTHVRGSITIVHGPKGCTHHNFSLLHATALDNDRVTIPSLVSTGLKDNEIIFGGEGALEQTIESVVQDAPDIIFVLSTCIVDTIGDDVAAVCGRERGVTVVPIPTAGFLGGTFQTGVNNALITIADIAAPGSKNGCVNIIGEKNLEYEVKENYAEVEHLLTALGLSVNLRFVHDCSSNDITRLGAARVNILRDETLLPVGERLWQRFETPYIPAFPVGLSGTIAFLEAVADGCGVNCRRAVEEERALQNEMLADFADLAGTAVYFDHHGGELDSLRVASEAAKMLGITVKSHGCAVSLPTTTPVGTAGVRRILHRWRRSIHA